MDFLDHVGDIGEELDIKIVRCLSYIHISMKLKEGDKIMRK